MGEACNPKEEHGAESVRVVALSCERFTNPVGFDTLRPLLSREIVSTRRRTMQTACQVVVAGRRDKGRL
jgi:hypothetical protein